jgi:hypothetical protein
MVLRYRNTNWRRRVTDSCCETCRKLSNSNICTLETLKELLMQRERHTTYQQDDKCLGPPTEEAHAGCSELPETKVPEVSVNCLKISSATCCSFGNTC